MVAVTVAELPNIHRKAKRKLEIQQLQDEGEAAFIAGRSIYTVPHVYLHTMNRHHWEEGFKAAELHAEQMKENYERDTVYTYINDIRDSTLSVDERLKRVAQALEYLYETGKA